jgi:hypothetical protein
VSFTDDGNATFEVRHGSGQATDPMEAAGTQGTAPDLAFHESGGGGIHRSHIVEIGPGEFGVGADPPGGGAPTRLGHPGGDGRRPLGGFTAQELVGIGSVDTNSDVKSIEEGSGETPGVPLPGRFAASARPGRTAIAARARVHGADHDEPGRERRRPAGSTHPHLALLEGLAQSIEHDRRELPHLIEEQHPTMYKGRLMSPE